MSNPAMKSLMAIRNEGILGYRKIIRQLPRIMNESGLSHYLAYLKEVLTPPLPHSEALDEETIRKRDVLAYFNPPATKRWGVEKSLGRFYKNCYLCLHHFAIPWMAWPRKLFYMLIRYRFWDNLEWDLGLAFLDIWVVLFSPIAIVLFLTLTTLLVLMDMLAVARSFVSTV